MNHPTLPAPPRKEFCYLEFAGLMILVAYAAGFLFVLACLGQVSGPFPPNDDRDADQAETEEPEETERLEGSALYEDNPCGGLLEQARITARDRAAKDRNDALKGGAQ